MPKNVLDIAPYEADFFENTWLFAIAAPGSRNYQIAWLLNLAFGLCLCRKSELDVSLVLHRKKKGLTLFDHEEGPSSETIYFPVFQHAIQFAESSVFLYTNKNSESRLIPEIKDADVFLLVPFDFGINKEELTTAFHRIPEFQWTKEVDINTLKSKSNLTF